MVDSHLTQLSTKVSIDSINICNLLFEIREYEIGNQLKRACTSIGAKIDEANKEKNRIEYIHNLNIALKECNESIYWIDTIRLNVILELKDLAELYENCYSIQRLLKTIIEAEDINPE